ncbi:MAG: hypothetical protein ACHQ50_13865 [Fimbriimonadales bacterium]
MLGLVLVSGATSIANAASLNIFYSKAPAGSLWQYTMTLAVDTSSSSWSAGMGWDWLIIGDVPSGTSPISDFAVTSGFPVGPWTGLTSSGGGHNGPTFAPVTGAFWVPSSASDTLTWTGTSAFNASPGDLTFSELILEGGATGDNWKPMVAVPEPASLVILGVLMPIAMRRRRAR